MTEHEQARVAALVHPAAAAELARGRRLVRQWIAEACKITPTALSLETNAAGAPCPIALAQPVLPSWSRSQGWVALGLSPTPGFGLDIECPRAIDQAAVLKTICSPDEQRQLAMRDPDPGLFWRIWTAKEAMLKALGTGFQTPVRAITLPIAELADPAAGDLSVEAVGRTLDLSVEARPDRVIAAAWIRS